MIAQHDVHDVNDGDGPWLGGARYAGNSLEDWGAQISESDDRFSGAYFGRGADVGGPGSRQDLEIRLRAQIRASSADFRGEAPAGHTSGRPCTTSRCCWSRSTPFEGGVRAEARDASAEGVSAIAHTMRTQSFPCMPHTHGACVYARAML